MKQRLRVLTLNLWAQHGPWLARAAAVRAGLLVEQPDVIALQEVLGFADGTTQLDPLCDPLPAGLYPGRAYGLACQLPAGAAGAQRTFGNALLARFPIIAHCNIALPNPGQCEPRALLAGLVALPTGQLPVFVTHLDWQLDSSHARCQQVRFIADQIDLWVAAARRRPGADVLPAVLAGDFNAEPGSDEIRFLTGHHALASPLDPVPRGVYFNDCYARVASPHDRRPARAAAARDDASAASADNIADGEDDGGATFARRNPFAARAREPDRRIDYIFAALPDAQGRGEPLRAWRCFRVPYLDPSLDPSDPAGPDPSAAAAEGSPSAAVFASDHYGVAADLTA